MVKIFNFRLLQERNVDQEPANSSPAESAQQTLPGYVLGEDSTALRGRDGTKDPTCEAQVPCHS